MQRHEKTGRPLGSVSFIEGLEKTLGRLLKPKKAGRRSKDVNKQVWCPQIYRFDLCSDFKFSCFYFVIGMFSFYMAFIPVTGTGVKGKGQNITNKIQLDMGCTRRVGQNMLEQSAGAKVPDKVYLPGKLTYVIVSLFGGIVTGVVYHFLSIIREKRRQI